MNNATADNIRTQKNAPKRKNDTASGSAAVRWLLSTIIVGHFAIIGLTYLSNAQRSALSDQTLVAFQPYLVGCNWYVEWFPIEWTSQQAIDNVTRIEVSTSIDPKNWEPIFDSSTSSDRLRLKQLLHVFHKLAIDEETDGADVLLHSFFKHLLGNDSTQRSIRMVQIDRTKPNEPEMIYQANVVRVDNQIQFIPRIESMRTVERFSDPKD